MARTILFFFATVIAMLIGFVLWPVGFFLKLIRQEKACNWVMFGYVTLCCKLGLRMNGIHIDEARGLENISDTQPALYVMNHRSIFDIIINYSFMKFPTGFVAKKEMRKVPIFSVWMWWVKCLFLDRSDIRQGLQIINKGADQMKSGLNMSIFPEGTRNKNYEDQASLLPFHAGSLKIATKAGCPIVPVAIYGSSKCFEEDFPKMHSCHVKVAYGTPIYYDELDKETKKHFVQYVENTIHGMLQELSGSESSK